MRVVYLCADRGIPVGGHKGASAHVRGLVRAFSRLGHDVVLLASDAGTGSLDPLVRVVRIPEPGLLEGLRVDRAPRVYRALGHLWNNGNVERSLEQVVEAHAPDLLYERYSPFGIAGGVVARRHGLPHVLEVNAPLAWEGAQYRRQALADAAEGLEYAAFANAQHLLVVSAELCDLLVEAGHDRDRIHVVPNGVDDSLFTPAARRPCTDTVTIGFVGSLKPWHGLENLRDAFVQLAPDPRYRLLVVGDGPANGVLGELACTYPERVLLTGAARHEDIPALLGRMDIAVAPYPPIENFYFSPLKVLEYMAAGLPVVASDIGQLRQLVRPGETGVLVPPGDASALSAAIRALAEDPSLMMRMGATGSAEVLREHTWVQRAESIMSLAAAGPVGAAALLQATV